MARDAERKSKTIHTLDVLRVWLSTSNIFAALARTRLSNSVLVMLQPNLEIASRR